MLCLWDVQYIFFSKNTTMLPRLSLRGQYFTKLSIPVQHTVSLLKQLQVALTDTLLLFLPVTQITHCVHPVVYIVSGLDV